MLIVQSPGKKDTVWLALSSLCIVFFAVCAPKWGHGWRRHKQLGLSVSASMIYLSSIYPIVLGTVGAPLCGESWAMSHGGAHPSPCQTTAKILQLGGLPWSWVLDWRSLQPGRWPHHGSSYNQQCSTSIAMRKAVPGYIVPVAGKIPGLTVWSTHSKLLIFKEREDMNPFQCCLWYEYHQ